jgi:L-lactate utilization protein LutB
MYNQIASDESINKTMAALKEHGMEAEVVATGAEALARIKELIPSGASVMNGASRTLEQIGYIDYLKNGDHGWNNLHEQILAEKDPVKQTALRRQSVLSDYYLGSVHALAEIGEFLIASNTGSQLPHVVYTSPNPIFVVGAQKIVPTLDQAMKRLEEHVIPLENERMISAHGMGTQLSKLLIFKKENPFAGRKVRVIIVKEALGF